MSGRHQPCYLTPAEPGLGAAAVLLWDRIEPDVQRRLHEETLAQSVETEINPAAANGASISRTATAACLTA